MQKHAALTLVLTLILLGSVYFLFAPPPEAQVLVSDDGSFIYRGLSRDTDLELRTDHGGASTSRLSPIYTVAPDLILESVATISIASDATRESTVLARFSNEKDVWEPLATEWDAGRFFTEVSDTGSFALLRAQDAMAHGVFNQLILQALEQTPKNTEFVQFQLAYATERDDFVLMPNSKATAGCGGKSLVGLPSSSITTIEQVGEIKVNGVMISATLKLVAEWVVRDGCTDSVLELVP